LANVPSAEKRNRQRIKRRARNLMHLVPMRTRVKRARTALDSVKEAPETVEPAVLAALRELARAAQKGVIHKKTAARKISRLTRAANKAKPAIKAAIEAKAAQPAGVKTGAKKPSTKKAASPKGESKK
jgi:small subunit ribosomal protein S20